MQQRKVQILFDPASEIVRLSALNNWGTRSFDFGLARISSPIAAPGVVVPTAAGLGLYLCATGLLFQRPGGNGTLNLSPWRKSQIEPLQ